MQTPVEMGRGYLGGVKAPVSPLGGNMSQLPSAISNIAQASSSLTNEKRRGSEFSFYTQEEPKKEEESGSFRAMDWYQQLLGINPQLSPQKEKKKDKSP